MLKILSNITQQWHGILLFQTVILIGISKGISPSSIFVYPYDIDLTKLFILLATGRQGKANITRLPQICVLFMFALLSHSLGYIDVHSLLQNNLCMSGVSYIVCRMALQNAKWDMNRLIL